MFEDRPSTIEEPTETKPLRPSMWWRIILLLIAIGAGIVVAMAQSGSLRRGGIAALVVTAAIVTVAVVLVWVFSTARHGREKQRQARIEFASEHPVIIRKSDAGELKRRFRQLPEIRNSGKIKHVIEGELDGRTMYGFEHMHVVNTGNAVIPVQKTVYAIETPAWPRVDIKRTSSVGRLFRRVFGKTDLQFDLPEFNRHMRVATTDPNFAITMLSPELQRHILSKTSASWRLMDGWLFLIYSGPMRFDRAPASMARLSEFWRHIPPELEFWQSE